MSIFALIKQKRYRRMFLQVNVLLLVSIYVLVLQSPTKNIVGTDFYIDISYAKYNTSLDIGVPALLISGPAKTGTTSLLKTLSLYPDVLYRAIEEFFWAPLGHPSKCSPILNDTEWSKYLHLYNSNQTNLSSLIPMIYSSNVGAKQCNRSFYVSQFKTENIKGLTNQCINPLHHNMINISNKYIGYCWFIEKSPSYARHPFVPILISNLLPLTRYLTILRNPVTHLWSAFHHFKTHLIQTAFRNHSQQHLKEQTVINYFNISSIQYLNGICDNIYYNYSLVNKSNNKQIYLLIKNDLKTLIVEYFKRRYIYPKDIALSYKVDKATAVIWSTYHVPILLIGLFVNEEIYKTDLLNYKWIQFEWLWNDTLSSIRYLRCWMTQGYRINNNKCEFERNDIVNQHLFQHIEKMNSRAKAYQFTEWYSTHVVQIFNSCNNVLENILIKHRSDLLIGKWQKWKYF